VLQFIENLVPIILDVINVQDSCPKSGENNWLEPEFAKKAGSQTRQS